MFQKLHQAYFTDKNYGLLYSHRFFRAVAIAAMYIFTGAYFLTLGMELHYVLLFYGLEFGVRGALCPWGVKILNHFGLIKSQIISAILMILFFVGISFADQNLWIGFLSLFLAAMSGAIYYPLSDIIEAMYIQNNENRTKQISMGIALDALGRVISAALVGYLITHQGFESVLALTTIFITLSLIPFFYMDDHVKDTTDLTPPQTYSYLLSKEFKPYLLPLAGLQFTIIVRAVSIPLFIYFIVGELDDMGYLIALALIAEKIFTLSAGHLTDKWGVRKAIGFSSLSYPVALAFYSFFAKTPFTVFLAESLHKMSFNVFISAFTSGLHRQARDQNRKNLLLFGTGWQMALCFGEVIFLPLFALLAYFIGTDVFYIIFAMGAVGVWMSYWYFRKQL